MSPNSLCLTDEMVAAIAEGEAAAGAALLHLESCDPCRTLVSGACAARAETPSETNASDRIAAGTLLGNCRIERPLGAGGMGLVYLARDTVLDRYVAIKLLHAHGELAHARLVRESQALAKLNHPNVVTVHEVGTRGQASYLVMEHVDGGTVREWTVAAQRTPLEIAEVYAQAAQGLAAAHAAGLVHRDIKPDNVLIGSDGRVRISDFGLVGGSAASHARGTGQTQAGTLLGTPGYMAPEVHAGGAADARSDQWSLCASLREALLGDREPTPEVPGWLRRAVERGLAADPLARFATVDELASALRPSRAHGRRTVLAIAAAAVLAGGVGMSLAFASRGPAPCQNASEQLSGIWDSSRAAAIASAFERARLPYAGASLATVKKLGDGYAAQWVAMRKDACEATRVNGEQTEAVLELRMTCLDNRLRSLDALGRELSGASATTVEHAVQSMHGLSPISDCADVEMLRRAVAPPADLLTRARVDGAQVVLAGVVAERDTGQYRRAYGEVQRLVELVRAIGYRPLEAEALELAGDLAETLGLYADAERWLRDAGLAAEAGRHDRARARVLIASVSVVGYELNRIGDAELLSQRAEAAIERLGKPPELRAALLESRATVNGRAGRLEEARHDYEAALGLLEPLHGKDDLRLAAPLHSIGTLLVHEDRGAEGLPYLRHALEIRRRALGDDHPDVAESLQEIGNAQFVTARYDDAIATYDRVRQMVERVYGKEHAQTARVLANLARTYAWQGKNDESVVLYRRALAILERVNGPEQQILATLDALATSLEALDNYAEARPITERVLKARITTLGPDHPSIAASLESLAILDLDEGKLVAARDHARAAYEMNKRTLGNAYRPTAEPRTWGEALLRLGQPGQAVDALEISYAGLTAGDDPGERAWVESALGEALVESGRDPSRGKALVLGAWNVIHADERMDEMRPKLAAWMKRHGVATVP